VARGRPGNAEPAGAGPPGGRPGDRGAARPAPAGAAPVRRGAARHSAQSPDRPVRRGPGGPARSRAADPGLLAARADAVLAVGAPHDVPEPDPPPPDAPECGAAEC